jgi:predicted DNA-binding transcriptional regulator YafY
LLTILLLLQTREQVTARELSERLEVSRRTIYRDLEALAAAGVALYAERGYGGGWRMLEGGKLKLPALDTAQLRALQLGGRRDLLDDLGLRDAAMLAWSQLAVARGEEDTPQPLDERLLIDSPSWRERRDDGAALAEIQRAVFHNRRLQILYDRSGEPVARTLDPLGLVVKGSTWYLVAAADGQPRTYRVSRVLEATQLPEPAQRPDDFHLRAWWDEQQRGFVARLPRYPVLALARGEALATLAHGGWYATVERQSGPDADGYCDLELVFNAEYYALGWVFAGGADVVIRQPEALRARLAAQAARWLARLESSTTPRLADEY